MEPPIQDGHVVSGEFAAETSPYLRVVRDGSALFAIAGNTTRSIGVQASQETIAANARGSVRLHQVGTTVMEAAGAIAVGAEVFAAAGGRVAAAGSVSEGVALTAASAAGERVEVCTASRS